MSTDLQRRVDRANVMLAALKSETERGQACAGDAYLDEVLKEIFERRFIDDSKLSKEMLSESSPLGSHGARVRVAYALGWIGRDTFDDLRLIRTVRNRMAHTLDVVSFDHEKVCGIIDGLAAPKQGEGVRLVRRKDKFLVR